MTNPLEAVAESLRQFIETQEPTRNPDHSVVCEAVWIIHGEHAELSEHYDDAMICDGNTRLYWVIPNSPEEQTICVADGIVHIGTVESVTSMLNAQYCMDNDVMQCKRCGHFNDEYTEGVAECWSCGHHIDGSDNPELSTLLEEKDWQFIEDGDYNCYYRYRHPIPTHNTETHQTIVWFRLQYFEGQCSELPRYGASIVCVNPKMAGKKGVKAMLESMGLDEEWEEEVWEQLDLGAKAVREGKRNGLEQMLIEYGTCATYFETSGNSKSDVTRKVLQQLKAFTVVAGFYLDAPQNRIGSSGWEFMKGDIMAGLDRMGSSGWDDKDS